MQHIGLNQLVRGLRDAAEVDLNINLIRLI